MHRKKQVPAKWMNGSVSPVTNAYQDHSIVMGRLIAQIHQMKLDAVSKIISPYINANQAKNELYLNDDKNIRT